MSKLIITRGLPASGKTTRARAWIAEDPARRIRVNRDDLRKMFDEGKYLKGITEPRVILARDALIMRALNKGLDVINDDTNLQQRVARDLLKLAEICKADFEVWDLTDVPLDTCVQRNWERGLLNPEHSVPEHVIHEMHRKYLNNKYYPLPLPVNEDVHVTGSRYHRDLLLPKAWIVDIDGTVALHGTRDPFDETRVHEDRPNEDTIRIVQMLYAAGYRIVFLSGRTAGCYDETKAWLEKHLAVGPIELIMRPKGDTRKDAIVKNELFWQHVAKKYQVMGVLDDRNQVVKMWREVLGIFCMQVADGNF